MRRLLILIWNIILVVGLCSCQKENAIVVTDDKQVASDEYGVDIATGVDAIAGNQVAVYVCGAVAYPGVYYLAADSIKEEALVAAGGFVDGAASTYVNLAEKIREGERIYFPYEEELGVDYSPISGITSDGKVNINTATLDELMTLPGVGESKACSIIEYRQDNGSFEDIEDIKNIPGIKDGIYNNIKDYIVVN